MQKPKFTYFFNKQPVYKQLVLKWQIAKHLSGMNPLSLSNNRNYGFRICNKYKTAVRPTIHQYSASSKVVLEKIWFGSWKSQVYNFVNNLKGNCFGMAKPVYKNAKSWEKSWTICSDELYFDAA